MLGEILTTTAKFDSWLHPKSPTVIGAPQVPNGNFISEAGALGSNGIKGLFAGTNGELVGSQVGDMLGIGGTLGAAIGGALMGKKKEKTSTVSLKIDIVKTVEYQFEQEVASHPVETGFEIQDNVVNKPIKITMTVGVSSAPVTWFIANGKGKHKFANAFDALMAIRDAKQPVTITRPDRIFSDMMMTSCKLTKSQESLSVMMVEVSFVKIVKVDTETVEIPKEYVDKAAKEKAGLTKKASGRAGKKGKGTDLASMVSAELEGAEDVIEKIKPQPNQSTLVWIGKKAGALK